MYAIIRSGGKQYRVHENRVVRLELLDSDVGSHVELNDVALLSGGADLLVGKPGVDGARVMGKVVAQGRTRRIVVYKFKPKKGYHRRRGHRQHYHDVLIQQILAPGQEPRRQRQAEAAPVESKPSPVEETSMEETAMEETPTPVVTAPVAETPAPIEAAPVEVASSPVEAAVVAESPTPVEAAPVEETPAAVETGSSTVEGAPAPVESTPEPADES